MTINDLLPARIKQILIDANNGKSKSIMRTSLAFPLYFSDEANIEIKITYKDGSNSIHEIPILKLGE